jgi:transcriptional regulator with XRE-family HTH domain
VPGAIRPTSQRYATRPASRATRVRWRGFLSVGTSKCFAAGERLLHTLTPPTGNYFGAALRQRRLAAGLTQRTLAEQAGIDFSYISKLENGRLPPPAADTIVTICRVLRIPAEEFLALTRKIPSTVQAMVSGSPSAQRFLLEADQLALTDAEWSDLVRSLHRLRGSSA